MTAGAVPPREEWPDPPAPTRAGELLTQVILATFRLNGRLLDVAQERAAEGGLTAAWWQVLGASSTSRGPSPGSPGGWE